MIKSNFKILSLSLIFTILIFMGPISVSAVATPTISTITYTTTPLTVSDTENLQVTLIDSTAIYTSRSYFMSVSAVRTSGTYQIASANINLPVGTTTKNFNFNVTFNTSGDFYTLIKVYDTQGGTLLTQRQGANPDTIQPKISSVPYYNQYANIYDGGSTCNLTSVSMLLDYYGITVPGVNTGGYSRTPDYLYSVEGGPVYSADGIDSAFNYTSSNKGSSKRMSSVYGTVSQLRAELATGRPVIVQGWFTTAGHVIVVTDYSNGYYTCNDPAGNWDGALSFNPRNTPYDSYGKQVRYYYADFERAAIDGDILYHVIR